MEILDFIKPSRIKRQKRRDKRLYKELIECRRGNGGAKNKKLRHKGAQRKVQRGFQLDSLPTRLSMGEKRSTTYQTDNLEPLIRFLKSHCGQLWNKVYSKLNHQLDRRSAIGIHVIDHLWHFVNTNAKYENGQMVFYNRNGAQPRYFRPERVWFYVDPRTGILIDNKDKVQKGPYPKKARWKLEKKKRMRNAKTWFLKKAEPRYPFDQVKTQQQRLKIRQVYDINVTLLEKEPKEVLFRIKLEKIEIIRSNLFLVGKVLKSTNPNAIGERFSFFENRVRIIDIVRFMDHRNFSWFIYNAGDLELPKIREDHCIEH